jgi:hypothetical protein
VQAPGATQRSREFISIRTHPDRLANASKVDKEAATAKFQVSGCRSHSAGHRLTILPGCSRRILRPV